MHRTVWKLGKSEGISNTSFKWFLLIHELVEIHRFQIILLNFVLILNCEPELADSDLSTKNTIWRKTLRANDNFSSYTTNAIISFPMAFFPKTAPFNRSWKLMIQSKGMCRGFMLNCNRWEPFLDCQMHFHKWQVL